MYQISFRTVFLKQAKRLNKSRYNLLKSKIELLKNPNSYYLLKVHKLHGEFSDRYSFSLDYSFRVTFKFNSKTEIILIAVGNHDIYK